MKTQPSQFVSPTRQHLRQARLLQQQVDILERRSIRDPHQEDQQKLAELRQSIRTHRTEAAQLRSQALGWRGATLAIEAGGVFTIPLIADLGAYAGGQISGPDTGNPAIDGFAKASVGTTLGVSAGYAVGRERNGRYGGAGILNVGYQAGNPISGKSVSVRWPGLGSLSLNQRGYGVTLHFPIGFYLPGGFKLEAAASMDLEHPALERINRPIFGGIDYALERARRDMEIVKKTYPASHRVGFPVQASDPIRTIQSAESGKEF